MPNSDKGHGDSKTIKKVEAIFSVSPERPSQNFVSGHLPTTLVYLGNWWGCSQAISVNPVPILDKKKD